MKKTILSILMIAVCAIAQAQRSETILKEWEFRKGHDIEATEGWEAVSVPHDWAIYGPFDKANYLASIPKDRYYLYRSQWNKTDHTLHVLPHWNWEGREGEVTPVFVYTSYPSAELFVNGISQGILTFADSDGKTPCLGEKAMERFRLMWNDVVYQPGDISVEVSGKGVRKAILKIKTE